MHHSSKKEPRKHGLRQKLISISCARFSGGEIFTVTIHYQYEELQLKETWFLGFLHLKTRMEQKRFLTLKNDQIT